MDTTLQSILDGTYATGGAATPAAATPAPASSGSSFFSGLSSFLNGAAPLITPITNAVNGTPNAQAAAVAPASTTADHTTLLILGAVGLVVAVLLFARR
jgi:hypothetical protein